MTVFENVNKEDIKNLEGFSEQEIKTVYEELRLKSKDVTLILYTSKKLLLQGKKDAVEKVAKKLGKVGVRKKSEQETFRKEKGWIIGTDESLKGDTFGGLVVAGVKANDKLREKLLELGVRDSKRLQDQEILIMAESIKRLVPCEIKSILPEEYNHSGKVTVLLNKFHKECADYLSPGKHIVDKYPGCEVGDIRIIKAESKYVEVAAASVLARATALKQLNYLSVLAGYRLPKGSAHVQLALHEMKDRKLDFNKFAKVSFSNVKEYL